MMRLIIAGASVLLVTSMARADVTLYVAPKGQDTNPGTRDAPLATLAGARDRVRKIQSTQQPQPVTVLFDAGTYSLTQAVVFSENDSGSKQAPVLYRAETTGTVRFSGGVTVTGWKPVTHPDILERLPEPARGHVLMADLKSQGIRDYGKLSVHGFA